ncbi:MAG: CDP-diacylglycerol--serine O-phosphatidyltransferase [Bacteroidales bacterium]|nr:CDP-diacylglycerol--serine O-phosphatidyltransferase [Bacteroidales bacterium]
MKKTIPSFITCLALFSGCISIACSANGNLAAAGYFILIASVFDFLDGMFARMLKAISALGKQLDSLSDAVSFGVAPALIMFRLMTDSLQDQVEIEGFARHVFLYSSFIIVIFAVLRLAKFNIDDTQSKSFRGLPTPATALFVSSLGVLSETRAGIPLYNLTGNLWFLLIVNLLFSALMITNIRMFSLKFENLNLQNNWSRYTLLILSIVILILVGIPGLAVIIALYIIMSVATNLLKIKN